MLASTSTSCRSFDLLQQIMVLRRVRNDSHNFNSASYLEIVHSLEKINEGKKHTGISHEDYMYKKEWSQNTSTLEREREGQEIAFESRCTWVPRDAYKSLQLINFFFFFPGVVTSMLYKIHETLVTEKRKILSVYMQVDWIENCQLPYARPVANR